MRELPAGWTATNLGELGTYVNGRAFKPSDWQTTGRPIIRIQNLTGTSSKFNHFDGEVDPRLIVRRGDLLISWSATLGSYIWDGPEAVLNQHIFRVDSFINKRFHKYLIDHVLSQLQSKAHGSGMVHITRKPFADTPIQLPPPSEQDRIVAAIEQEFSRIDAATRLLGATSRGLGRLRSAVLATITSADSSWTTLGEIAEIVGGVTKDSKRQRDPSFVEVPYLRVANVQRGYLDLGEVTTIRVPRDKAASLCLKAGDILFNEGGDRDKLGRGWVWQDEIDECIHQNHVFRARLLDGRFDPKFVSMHGNTFGQRWFERMGKQSTNLASINLKTLKAFPVPELPLEDQTRIVAEAERQLTLADSCSIEVQHALIRSGHLRSAVLASAFAGRLSN